MAYPALRGIRDFGPGDYLVDPAWQAGYALLGRFGLVSCIDTRPQHFPKIKRLAASFPDTRSASTIAASRSSGRTTTTGPGWPACATWPSSPTSP